MSEIVDQLSTVHRAIGAKRIPAGDSRVVLLRRGYDAAIEDVWEACTDPERLSRWFLPVTGDLNLGGRYQLKGNANGEILRCEAPRLLKVTWVYAENPTEQDISEVEIRLSSEADGSTTLELEHAAVVPDQFWEQYGPGAVGVGWDSGLLGLEHYLRTGSFDEDTWQHTPAAKEFLTGSSQAWGAVHAASGAPADQVAETVESTTGFHVPSQEDPPSRD